MEEPHSAAARALLDQLIATGPGAPSRSTAAEPLALDGPARPPVAPIPQAAELRHEPDPYQPAEPEARAEEGQCSACGASFNPAVAWCVRCLTPRPGHRPTAAPGEPLTTRPGLPEMRPVEGETPRPGVARSAVWLAVTVIAFNIAVQASTFALERSARVQSDTAIAIGLWVGLLFYLVVAAYALRTRAAAFVRTAWTVGDPRAALRHGLLVGGLASGVALGIQSAAVHHLVGDPTVQLVVSDGSPWRILAAFALFVGLGPLVEEYIFRGVLAESLKGRGTRSAISISALLFALAHLRPAGLIYYSIMGAIFGRLYFKYGLKASVAAHAIFNGLLVVAAIASVVGPASTFPVDGAELHLPAAWKTMTPPDGLPFQFAARGPSGAVLMVLDRPVPPGSTFDPAAAEAAAMSHQLPIPDGETITSASTVQYPAGAAAEFTLVAHGYPGKVDLMVEHGREWLFVLSSGGSSRASADFDHMMHQLTLP